MKIVLVPDSFKGSLDSNQVIGLIRKGILRHFPHAQIVEMPMADGGEGSLDLLCNLLGAKKIQAQVKDPYGKVIPCYYGCSGSLAIIEMARASGLTLIDSLNPMETSSFGTGQLINAGLERGCRDFLIGIGGSATNDGGTGMLEALGVLFFDEDDQIIKDMCGSKLKEVRRICLSQVKEDLFKSRIRVMCDVDNPLTGPRGATYTYGQQKGADAYMLRVLESGMKSYRRVLTDHLGLDYGDYPGVGAAGGMGMAFKALLGGDLASGSETLLEMVDFKKKIEGAHLVITGEGRLDQQSFQGKVVGRVCEYASTQSIPILGLVGGLDGPASFFEAHGLSACLTLPNRPMSLEEALEETEDLIGQKVDLMCQLIKIGQMMK